MRVGAVQEVWEELYGGSVAAVATGWSVVIERLFDGVAYECIQCVCACEWSGRNARSFCRDGGVV